MSQELVEAAADALLPMILLEPGSYQAIGEELLQGQKDEQARAALLRALNHLMAGGGVTGSLDRKNKKRFRANLHHFVGDVKGLLRKR